MLNKDLGRHEDIEEQIDSVKKMLEAQILETERLKQDLESPNQDRIRHHTNSEDPSEEDLAAKLSTLERLVKHKKEVLLTKSIEFEEVQVRIQQLKEAKKQWQSTTQTIFNGINEYQGRLHEKQRIRTAIQSELRMYDEIIASSKKKLAELEHDITLRQKLAISSNIEAKCNSVVDRSDNIKPSKSTTPTKRNSYERPTAYLPNSRHSLNIPRPVRFIYVIRYHYLISYICLYFVSSQYGRMAPFKPGKTVKSMRETELYRLKQATH